MFAVNGHNNVSLESAVQLGVHLINSFPSPVCPIAHPATNTKAQCHGCPEAHQVEEACRTSDCARGTVCGQPARDGPEHDFTKGRHLW